MTEYQYNPNGRISNIAVPMQKISNLITQVTESPDLKHGSKSKNNHNYDSSQSIQQENTVYPNQNDCIGIAHLERQMMFLSEPSIQNYQLSKEGSHKSEDTLKFLWKVHQQQMHFQELSQYKEVEEGKQTLTNYEKQRMQQKRWLQKPFDIEKEGSLVMKFQAASNPSFKVSSQSNMGGTAEVDYSKAFPREFSQFQQVIHSQMKSMQDTFEELRVKFKGACVNMDQEVDKVEQSQKTLQLAFNDFAYVVNSFSEREQRLSTLHQQAIKKSQELSQKVQLELLAHSSQRGQLLQIVEDLGNQLQESKMKQEATEDLVKLLQNQQAIATADRLKGHGSEIRELNNIVENLNSKIETLNQTNKGLFNDKKNLIDQAKGLRQNIDNQNRALAELTDLKMNLNAEVSQLRSNLELTTSSKDKIILKLRTEIQQLSAMQNQHLTRSSN